MADPAPTENERLARAEQALAPFRRPGQAEYDALTELMTSVRTYAPGYFQEAVEASRTAWHRQRVAADFSWTGDGPRAEAWRDQLEHQYIVGEHWSAWPEELKAGIVDACVRAEATAMAQRLIAWGNETGHAATWHPETGRIEFATDAGADAFNTQTRQEIRAAAYLTVLDQYQGIENQHRQLFVSAKVGQLRQRGYETAFRGRPLSNEDYIATDVADGVVAYHVGDHNEVTAVNAKALADFAAVADGIPPRKVDPALHAQWRHFEYTAQAHRTVPDFLQYDSSTQVGFYAALADARTTAVNNVLDGTGHVWDPRLNASVPLPHLQPPPLDAHHVTAVEQAKASVQPSAVWQAFTRREPSDSVALAFPEGAQAPQVDTGTTGEPGHAPAPAPER